MCVSMCDFLGRVHGLDNFMMVTAKKVVISEDCLLSCL